MKSLALNRVTFAVPTRQFSIDASVTVNESLPKVTEFVLRMIRLCEGISPEEIGSYFGFSGKETRLILESLRDQSLVDMQDELVRLTEYAETKFYTDDDLPRFSVVKPRTDLVDFDLLTFHPIDGRNRSRAPSFTAELPLEKERISTSARLAEQAYQKHFQTILRLREKGKDKIEIYKISKVESKRLFDSPLEVSFSLDDHFEVERIVDYADDAPEEFRLGMESAVSDALKRPISVQTEFLEEFIERFDDKVLAQFLSRKSFDFERYVREVFLDKSVAYSEFTEPFLGNLYMPDNQKTVLSWLKAGFKGESVEKCPSHFLTSVAWLAPDYKFWGRTALRDDFFFKVESSLPQLKSPKEFFEEHVHLLYPGSKETVWQLQQMLRSKQEKSVHFYSEMIMGGRIEVFFVPTQMAVVLFHFTPPGNSAALVPFGFITTAPSLVKEAQVVLMDATARGKAYVGKAHFNRDAPSPSSKFEDHFGFINYCAT